MLNRREFTLASTSLLASSSLAYAAPGALCDTCQGIGLVPLKDPKPYVWVEGMPAPKPEEAVPADPCPKCQPGKKNTDLIEAEAARLKTAHESNQEWELATKWMLTRVETRHGTLHTLTDQRDALACGQAMEKLTAHLQKLTGTLELTMLRPDSYMLFVLFEKDKYEHFRKTLEEKVGIDKLGKHWGEGRELGGYDLVATPFFYETRETVVFRPFPHGVMFFMGRRLMQTACRWRAPVWLSEGFAEYCEHAVMKKNLWYMIYDPGNRFTRGDFLFDLKHFHLGGKLRPLADMLTRELPDYTAEDYIQAFGMVKFILETDPRRFCNLAKFLMQGKSSQDALEAAVEVSVEKLQKPWEKWLKS